ncbi:glycosyltransferase family 9 protein [Niabella sp. CC-SYL272]|uniref:glycosyltransferase family 9 protein n=1 Tax=Niabella agricola TaxID=2891571 RepID=UPI001F252676|nr:glycosyltransferase family 9 protein [Niabella agricola]MCF3108329.1 glycosyltransferase family 9 protein [Niabella agricola]
MNIVVFRVLKLGDLLCTVPAFRALRRAFPKAHITLLGMPWATAFVKRYAAYIDAFLHFPGYPGLPEQEVTPRAFQLFFSAIKKKKIDLLLQLQGDGSIVNDLLEQFGARLLAGFCVPGDHRAEKRSFLEYPDHLHEIHRHLALLQQLSIPAAGDELEFPLLQNDFTEFDRIQHLLPATGYLCIHPGASVPERQWPPRYFAKLADHFAALGYPIVLTGTAAEKTLTATVAGMMHAPAIDLAGATTLGSMGVLLSRAEGLVTNCTGVSHLAAALKLRSVVISMDGAPHRWGPLNQQFHQTIDWTTCTNYDAVVAVAGRLFLSSA